MKKISLILALLIIIIGAYFLYINKFKGPSEDVNIFKHSSGAYSFEYPSSLFVSEKEGAAIIAQSEDINKPVAAIYVIYYPNYINQFEKNPELKITSKNINSYKVMVINHIQKPEYGKQYIVSLENNDNPSTFLVANMPPNVNDFTEEQFDALFDSVKFDKEKVLELGKELIELGRTKALEAKLKASLYSIRPAAELYYEAKMGYTGLCNPVGASQSENLLKNSYKAITDDIGAANISCMAEKLAYAFSIKIPSGIFLCIDSTGYNSTINQQVKGYSCK